MARPPSQMEPKLLGSKGLSKPKFALLSTSRLPSPVVMPKPSFVMPKTGHVEGSSDESSQLWRRTGVRGSSEVPLSPATLQTQTPGPVPAPVPGPVPALPHLTPPW